MDAAAERTSRVNLVETLPRLVRQLILVGLAMVAFVAIALLVSRLVSQSRAIPPGAFFALALATAATTHVTRRLWQATRDAARPASSPPLMSGLVAAVAAVLLGAVTPLAGSEWWTWGGWALFVAAEATFWWQPWRSSPSGLPPSSQLTETPPPDLSANLDSEEFDEHAMPQPELVDPNATQQLTRTRGEQGQDVLFGTLRAEFASGERTQSLHVAVCPPMHAVPECDVAQQSGSPARITATVVEPYGAKFDIRLDHVMHERCEVVVEFSLIEPTTE